MRALALLLLCSHAAPASSTEVRGLAVGPAGDVHVLSQTVGRDQGAAEMDYAFSFDVTTFTKEGAFVRSISVGPTERHTSANGLAADAAGNVYVVGCTAADFENRTLARRGRGPYAGKDRAFIMSLGAAGERRWVQDIDTRTWDDDCAFAAVADASSGDVHMAGTADSGAKVFLARVGADGVVKHVIQRSPPAEWWGGFDSTRSYLSVAGAVMDSSGNLRIGGSYLYDPPAAGSSEKVAVFLMSASPQGRWGKSSKEVIPAAKWNGFPQVAGVASTAQGVHLAVREGGSDRDNGVTLLTFDALGEAAFSTSPAAGRPGETTVPLAIASDRDGGIHVVGETGLYLEESSGAKRASTRDAFYMTFNSTGAWWYTEEIKGSPTLGHWGTRRYEVRASGAAADGNGTVFVAGTSDGCLAGVRCGRVMDPDRWRQERMYVMAFDDQGWASTVLLDEGQSLTSSRHVHSSSAPPCAGTGALHALTASLALAVWAAL